MDENTVSFTDADGKKTVFYLDVDSDNEISQTFILVPLDKDGNANPVTARLFAAMRDG